MSTKKVFLFIPCYVDHIFSEQARKAVDILHHMGYTVMILPDQPCCGQVAYNSGYFDEAKIFARKWLKFFPEGEHVVVLGASCTHMVKEVYPTLFDAEAFSLPFTVDDFLLFMLKHQVKEFFVPDISGKIAVHQSCTGLRKLYGGRNLTGELLKGFSKLEVIETTVDSQCCGFGGTFSIKFPEISVHMGTYKLEQICDAGATHLIASDVSCFMHLNAIQRKKNYPVQILTLIDFLHQSIKK